MTLRRSSAGFLIAILVVAGTLLADDDARAIGGCEIAQALAEVAASTGGNASLGAAASQAGRASCGGGGSSGGGEDPKPRYYTTSRVIGEGSAFGCGDIVDGDVSMSSCAMGFDICNFAGAATGSGQRSVEVVEVDTFDSSEELLGFDCRAPGVPQSSSGDGDGPVVITVTVEDFAKMPVEPLVPHAGPPNGWVPVNFVNVLYVEPEAQVLDVELLDTPVQVRAIPVSYHWDLGDGNTITTSKPGKPYPSEEVASEYTYEGWYDITLTTTFRGEFSVDGGEWQPIEGTIEVASDPVEIFAKSFESRLVDGDVPPDEEEDPWVPERSPETEGPQDPEARHREI